MFERLREYCRRRMPGMTPQVAAIHKYKLSMFYAFISWNAFGFILYTFMKEKFPKMNDSTDYAKLLGVKEATVIKYKGFSKVDEYRLKLEDSEIEEFHGIKKANPTNDGQERNENNEVEENYNLA